MALSVNYYRFGIDQLTESTHGWYAAENTNPEVGQIQCDSTFLLRFSVQETDVSAYNNITNQFQYRLNGGTWTNITTTSTHVKALAAVALTNGGHCSKRLSGTGTFESSGAGQTEDGNSGGTANDIVRAGNSETECGLQIVGANVALGDLIEFRLTTSSGFIYSVTAAVKVAKNVTVNNVPTGSATVTGCAPSRLTNAIRSLAVAACVLAGVAPTAQFVGGMTREVPTGSLAVTGSAPADVRSEFRSFWGTVPRVQLGTADHEPETETGAHAFTGRPPVTLKNIPISVPEGSLALSSAAATDHNWWEPATLTPQVGALSSGTLPLVYTDDSNYLVLTEVSGTPAFQYDFDWWDVPDTATLIHFNGQYVGNPAHVVLVYQYNFTSSTWTRLTSATNDIPSTAADEFRVWELLGNTGEWLGPGGTIRFRIEHTSAGNPVHTLRITHLVLEAGLQARARVASVALSGTTPTAVTGFVRTPSTGSLAVTGAAPDRLVDARRMPTVGSLALSGTTPSTAANETVEIPTGILRFGLYRNHFRIPVGSLALSGTVTTESHSYEVGPIAVPVGSAAFSLTTPARSSNWTIGVPAGSLTTTGAAPTRVLAEAIAVPVGSVALTGKAPTRVVDARRTPTVGSLALTGETPAASTAEEEHYITPAVGSVAVTGTTAVEIQGTIQVPTGSVTTTGTGFTSSLLHCAAAGQHEFTGVPPELYLGFKAQPRTGPLTLASTTPTRVKGYAANPILGVVQFFGTRPVSVVTNPTPGVGSVAISLTTPTLTRNDLRAPTVGSVAVTGLAPTRLEADLRAPTVGSLAFSGTTPSLERPERTIQVPVASLALTGRTPLAEGQGQRQIPVGSVEITGTAARLDAGWPLTAGALTLSGTTPVRLLAETIAVEVGTVAISGTTPTAISNDLRQVPVATVSLSGTLPSIERPERTIQVPVRTLAISGTTPTAVVTHVRQPGVVRVAVSGTTCPAPDIDKPSVVAVGSLAVSGTTPVRRVNHIRAIGVGSLAVSGTVTYSVEDCNALLLVGSVEFATTTPTVVATTDHYIWNIPTGSVALSSAAAGVNSSGDHYPEPGTARLTTTGEAPTRLTNHVIGVPAGSLASSGETPTRLEDDRRTPSVCRVSVTGLPCYGVIVLATGDSYCPIPIGSLTLNSSVWTSDYISATITGRAPTPTLTATAPSITFTAVSPTPTVTPMR